MHNILLVLLVGVGGLSNAAEQDLQLEKTRVTVLMWLISPVLPADAPVPDVSPDTGDETHQYCEKCHGTKKVKSGDGIVDIPCPCGRFCQCVRPDGPSPSPKPSGCGDHCRCKSPCTCGAGCRCPHCPNGRRNSRQDAPQQACADSVAVAAAISTRQLFIVGAAWCEPCRPVKATVRTLKRAGWDVSESDPKALILLLDFDKDTDLCAGHRLDKLPTILVLNDGQEELRLEGAAANLDAWAMPELLLGDMDSRTYLSPRGKLLTQTRTARTATTMRMRSIFLPPNASPAISQPIYEWDYRYTFVPRFR
jgi:hypothetical protein